MNRTIRSFALLLLLLQSSCATAGQSSSDAAEQNEVDASTSMIDAASTRADANECTSQPCTILPQCGCTGQVCDIDPELYETGGMHCRDVSAPGDDTANCSASTGCGAGFVCLGKQCRAYCSLDVPCDTGEHCIIEPVYQASPDVYEPIPGVAACSKSCSPELATGNGCPSSPQFGCHLRKEDPDGVPGNADDYYHSDCSSSQGRGDDEDCADTGDAGCAPGYECVGLGGGSVCKQLCVVPGGTCDGGRTCNAFADPKPIIAGIEYGVCQ